MRRFAIRRYMPWLFVGLLWLGGLAGCGTPHGLQVQFLDATTLKKVQFLDLAVFKTSVECSAINANTYLSSSGAVADARMVNKKRGAAIIPVLLTPSDLKDGKEYRAWIGELGGDEVLAAGDKGVDVLLYILALGKGENDTKVKLAEGCAKVKLIHQQTVTGSVTLATIGTP